MLDPISARLEQLAVMSDNSQLKKKKAPENSSAFHSPNWTRTSDTLINSQVLYRLSYGGSCSRIAQSVTEKSYVGIKRMRLDF